MTLREWQQQFKDINTLIVQASAKEGTDSWQPFPIGMGYKYALWYQQGDLLQIGSHEKTVLCAINPNTDTVRRNTGINRLTIEKNLNKNSISNTPLGDRYFLELPSYKFVVSPEGNGIDCHRHYEALLAGSIPIVERNSLIDEKYKGCPILYTTDYSEIKESYLLDVYAKMLDTPYDFSRLFLDFYTKDQIESIKDSGNYWVNRWTNRTWYTSVPKKLITQIYEPGLRNHLEAPIKDLERKMESVNKELVWVTFINYGYIHYTKNFLQSMEKNHIDFKLVVYCNDDKTFEELKDHPRCICKKTDFLKASFSERFSGWGHSEYIRICFAKLDVWLHALKETYALGVKAVGFIDTDVFLFSDPTPLFVKAMDEHKDIQVFAQCDENGSTCIKPDQCPNMCAGVMVFRNNPALYSLFEYTEADIRRFPSDQHYLHDLFVSRSVPRRTLARSVVPNGAYYPSLKRTPVEFGSEPCLIHFNWIVGNDKERVMRLQGLWLL